MMKPSIRYTEDSAMKHRSFRLGRAVKALMLAVPIALSATPAMAADVWDAARAVAGMERLREEIGGVPGLAAAQAELLAWNRLRAKTGAGPAVLPARLCAEAALAPWCPVLPATFGPAAAVSGVPAPASMAEPPARNRQTEDRNP